jgi:hypothetical protein
MLPASEIIPWFSILFLPIERTLKLGVPYKPLAISATPKGPKPQLLIKSTSKELAWVRK